MPTLVALTFGLGSLVWQTDCAKLTDINVTSVNNYKIFNKR